MAPREARGGPAEVDYAQRAGQRPRAEPPEARTSLRFHPEPEALGPTSRGRGGVPAVYPYTRRPGIRVRGAPHLPHDIATPGTMSALGPEPSPAGHSPAG